MVHKIYISLNHRDASLAEAHKKALDDIFGELATIVRGLTNIAQKLRPDEKITTGLESGSINANGIARCPHTNSMKASRFLLALRLHSPKLGIYFSVGPKSTAGYFGSAQSTGLV